MMRRREPRRERRPANARPTWPCAILEGVNNVSAIRWSSHIWLNHAGFQRRGQRLDNVRRPGVRMLGAVALPRLEGCDDATA